METYPTNLLLLIFFLLLSLTRLFDGTVAAFNGTATTPSYSSTSCHGSIIAECDQDMELLVESEASRRLLAQKRYISNGALKRDRPVCNGGGRGQPYSRGSGCLPQPSNTYNRGCSRYYRCRSDG